MPQYTITNEQGEIDFELKNTDTKRAVQNAHNLLMTRRGEVPYDRCRGFDQSLYDLPLTILKEKLLPEIDRVLAWEENAEAVSADASMREDGTIAISAVIEVTE